MSALSAAANDEDGDNIKALRAENEQLRQSLLAMHDTLEMTAKAGASYARANEGLRDAVIRWANRAEQAEDLLEAIGAGGVGKVEQPPSPDESAYQRGYMDGMAKGRRDATPDQPPVVEQVPIAYEFYNPATGHAIVDYSEHTHVGHLTSDKGYIAKTLYTHPQNLNCKSTQARLATLWGYVKERPQQEQEWKRRLGNLLAVIHGDGGHYIDAHGWDKAQADAEEKVARVMTGLPQSASVVWPRNASEVRAFLSGHVAAERYARDDHQPDDSDTYTLSAHDLLGAIDWWTDFDQRPRQPLTDEQIAETLIDATNGRSTGLGFKTLRTLTRAIERAHHIGDEK